MFNIKIIIIGYMAAILNFNLTLSEVVDNGTNCLVVSQFRQKNQDSRWFIGRYIISNDFT